MLLPLPNPQLHDHCLSEQLTEGASVVCYSGGRLIALAAKPKKLQFPAAFRPLFSGRKLLEKQSSKRLSAAQALAHEWHCRPALTMIVSLRSLIVLLSQTEGISSSPNDVHYSGAAPT